MITGLLAASVMLQAASPSFTLENSLANTPPGASFWAGYARRDAGDWVVEIYTRRSGGTGEYVLRRSLNTPEGREQMNWTTSTACPVVLNIVPSMERLSMGGLDAPRLEPAPRPWFTYPESIPVQPDSPGYVIWGRGRQPDGAMASYRVSVSNGLIAGFIERAEEALRPCWKATLERPDP